MGRGWEHDPHARVPRLTPLARVAPLLSVQEVDRAEWDIRPGQSGRLIVHRAMVRRGINTPEDLYRVLHAGERTADAAPVAPAPIEFGRAVVDEEDERSVLWAGAAVILVILGCAAFAIGMVLLAIGAARMALGM